MTSSPTFNKSGKILTDFSIKNIIGNQSDGYHQEHPISENHNRSIIKVEINGQSVSPFSSSSSSATSTQLNHLVTTQSPSPVRKYRPKNFICPACDMAFSNNGQLKTHVRIHTGERPFRCNHPNCNKTFTRNEELTRHKLIHTGVRPHSCTTCGKRFGRKDHLKKHARTHDRKKLKDIFAPSRSEFAEEDDVYVPPKVTRLNPESRQESNRLIDIVPQNSTLENEPANLIPVTTSDYVGSIPSRSSFDHFPQLQHLSLQPPINNTIMLQSNAAATSAIERLASDYWAHKWYDLMGFYHHQAPLNLSTG